MGAPNPKAKQICEYCKSHPKETKQEIADRFNTTYDVVSGILRRNQLRAGVLSKEEAMKKDLTGEARLESKLRASTNRNREADRKYRAIQDELEEKEEALRAALKIMGRKPKVTKITPRTKSGKGEATAFALLSDVHCDEVVPPEKVNGLNRHSPEISKRRVARFFELVVRFLRVERAESTVNNLVLWLGGDFFTNDMHGAPTAFPPMTAAMFAQDMIVSGITYVLTEEPNLKIHVVGSVGNHSRAQVGRPVNVALEQENSIEWIMYHSLRNHFKNVKNLTFQFDNSFHTYVEVYGKRVRFNHGHQGFRYNKGQAGIHGPLFKAIREVWDHQIKVDLTCIGHYHTVTFASPSRPYIVNGSTIGAAPYGLHFGFEEPAQVMFLIHSKYGIISQRPLLVDN